jgi:uroporphyrinogen decarboxylase
VRDLFLRACRREAVEATPVWIMRQAGRYLPEYRELRARHDFLTACRTPEIAAEITLQPVRRLDVDAAILFSDILLPLPGMGIDVAFNPGPVIARPVRSRADVDALRVPDPRDALPEVLEAVRILRRELKVPLIGFAGAPFTLAAYLVEGRGSHSWSAWKGMLFAEPAMARRLLDVCAATVAAILVEQVRAGAQAAMLFDTWAGILAPEDYETIARPAARRVFEAVRAADPTVPRIYYSGCGYLEAVREVGADVIGLDWRVRLSEARRRLGEGIAIQGNLDPAVLLGPRPLIEERVSRLLDEAPERGHVFNLGHGILPETPPENAARLVEAVRELSVRAVS